MDPSTPRRILIVAYRTAGTPGLLDEVRSRAPRSGVASCCSSRVPTGTPETEEAALTLELAIPLLTISIGELGATKVPIARRTSCRGPATLGR